VGEVGEVNQGMKSLFWSRSIGDFALCVNGKVDASCGGAPKGAEKLPPPFSVANFSVPQTRKPNASLRVTR